MTNGILFTKFVFTALTMSGCQTTSGHNRRYIKEMKLEPHSGTSKPRKKKMLRKITLLIVITSLTGLTAAVDLESKKEASRQAVQAFGKRLKVELVAAMNDGGPMNAIGVCNLEAPKIAQAVSTEKNLAITRTSLRFRNASNTPTGWQKKILTEFDEKNSAGQDPTRLEYAELVDTTAGPEFRYMKAIPTAEVCLKCHGSGLSNELTAKISELYPEDHATGFSIGDIRGAFVVVEKLK